MTDQEATALRHALRDLLDSADALVHSVTFDVSGIDGQGGNGGLVSNDTIRLSDDLRQALYVARRVLA